MILDPLYPAMSIANAAAVAVRPLLWIRQNARRIRHQWASKPAETFGPANGSGKEKCKPPRINSRLRRFQDPLDSAKCRP
jgi:hypothetical protein